MAKTKYEFILSSRKKPRKIIKKIALFFVMKIRDNRLVDSVDGDINSKPYGLMTRQTLHTEWSKMEYSH